MLDETNLKILNNFQRYGYETEHDYAIMRTRTPEMKLEFQNNNNAYTDGNCITVDPAYNDLFADKEITDKAIKLLNWPNDIADTPEKRIRIITRAQVIHECLHKLYTMFPIPTNTDPIADTPNKRKIINILSNIIEDSYIEAVGITMYNNIRYYLQFFRTCISLYNEQNMPQSNSSSASDSLDEFINYFIDYILYPINHKSQPSDKIKEYVQKAKPVFYQATLCNDPQKRYNYAVDIFKIIKPLIPRDDQERINQDQFNQKMPGSDTHNGNKTRPQPNNPNQKQPESSLFPQPQEQQPQAQPKTLEDPTEAKKGGNLFEGLPQEQQPQQPTKTTQEILQEENSKEQAQQSLENFTEEINAAIEKQKEIQKSEEAEEKKRIPNQKISGDEFKEFTSHKEITIFENHPENCKHHKKDYDEMVQDHKITINYYNTRFLQMLQTNTDVMESGYITGLSLNTKKLGDTKKRYWNRNSIQQDTPDLAILILIDGSGSMSGSKKTNATKSAVILHEILQKQQINHAIVEHRAHYSEKSMEANILVDFNSPDSDKYNLLRIRANDVNRDGLSLLWAERYLAKQPNENKVIIVISDGIPNHKNYKGENAVNDTKDIANKIINHGINVLAIALEEEQENTTSECYNKLKKIYTNIIDCPNPNNLTRKLLETINKLL